MNLLLAHPKRALRRTKSLIPIEMAKRNCNSYIRQNVEIVLIAMVYLVILLIMETGEI